MNNELKTVKKETEIENNGAILPVNQSTHLVKQQPNTKSGELLMIVGPMFSGKTKKLVSELSDFTVADMQKVAFVRSGQDTRDFLTRDETIKNSLDSSKITTIIIPVTEKGVLPMITKKYLDQLSNFDVIGVDEGHMFEIKHFKLAIRKLVFEYKKIVIIAGLDGDYKQCAFSYFTELSPYVTSGKLTKLTSAKCFECVRQFKLNSFYPVNCASYTCLIKPITKAKLATPTSPSPAPDSENDDIPKSNSPSKTETVKQNLDIKTPEKQKNSTKLVMEKFGKDEILAGDADIYEARCGLHLVLPITEDEIND